MQISKDAVVELVCDAVSRINNGVSKTLTARRDDESPPLDPRHLTDTRTRVSTLLEYSLSYEMNHILKERNEGFSISNVLWNVFPDLIVRDSARNNTMGLEIKALHTAAEEKSANLSTPLPLIRKARDFIVILIWGWSREPVNGTVITYPHIHDYRVFDAWLVAKFRDTTWLINNGNRVKGIDISTPIINGNNGEYKAEEGNLGKLMRINMSSDTSTELPYYEEMRTEATEYESFKGKTLALGIIETIKDICYVIDEEACIYANIETYPTQATLIATAQLNGRNIFFTAGPKNRNALAAAIGTTQPGDKTIHLGTKLDWTVFDAYEEWPEVGAGNKPETALPQIRELVIV